jgi:hypothetical protein
MVAAVAAVATAVVVVTPPPLLSTTTATTLVAKCMSETLFNFKITHLFTASIYKHKLFAHMLEHNNCWLLLASPVFC